MASRRSTTTTMTMEAPKEVQVPDMKTLRDAIPAKCFERSLLRGMGYVVRDLVAVSCLFYSATWIIKTDAPWTTTVPLWTLYSFVQGLFFTGLWILAHECGHDSFSSHKTLNGFIGWVLHSGLLVPFFSWKFSHARHHRYHNHMERDTVFVPSRKDQPKQSLLAKAMDHSAADTPILSMITLIIHQTLGWPAYVLLNAGAGVKSLVRSNRQETHKLKQSHFDPTASVFTPAEAPFVAISNLGLLLVFAALYQVAQSVGYCNTFLLYGLPYLWMNHWIVAITYLHHTHEEAHHYDEGTWTFQKGALSTIDREFGFIGRHIFHGIIEYHVIHHMFPRIPFYHAEEATWAVQPLLGNKYIQQKTNFTSDLWKSFTTCKFVEQIPNGPKGALRWAKS